MKAVTLRNIPPELVRLIERRSRQTGKSLNRTIIEALEESLLNRSKRKERRLNHDLDWMVGSWTKEEADEFDRALAEQRTIDPELCK
jgi:hypothetical protein